MPHRSSLKGCIETAIYRFQHGLATTAIIARYPHAKYYTLYYPVEWDAKALNRPSSREYIVLHCTGGELASIIGTAQMNLNLGEPDALPS